MSRRKADKAQLAQRAIDYLVQTDLVVRWDFPDDDPPPEDIKRLLMSYFADGEIEVTTSELLCSYLVSGLREDYPSLDEPSRSAHDHAPSSPRRPTCRLARCGDDD